MKSLAAIWTETERGIVGNALERLFLSQDRPLNDEKRAFLMAEITGYPVRSVLDALADLCTEDLRVIKLPVILQTIEKHLPRSEEGAGRSSCAYCDKGMVPMIRERDNGTTSFACNCPSGDLWKKQKPPMKAWDGGEFQEVRGESYRVYVSKRSAA